MMGEAILFRPQPGPQELFLSTPADIGIYGGAAGGGKSFALLLETLRHANFPGFDSVIFRRETPQIVNPGGLWSESTKIYPYFGARPNRQSLTWNFPSGMGVKFAHMQREDDRLAWQGAQVPFFGFDELTHFTENQFFYMLSRNRSMTGIPGYIRATCNPDPDSWVRKFIDWWIGPDGLPIEERKGKIRWFVRIAEEMFWGDDPVKLKKDLGGGPEVIPKSVTFIPAKLSDNKILMEKDPSYQANLSALARVDRARLLGGNWDIRVKSGELFDRYYFEVVDALPHNIVRGIRYWDRAATVPNEANKNPDWTVGLLLLQDGYGTLYVADVCRFRKRPLGVKQKIKQIAEYDTIKIPIGIEQDPGQAGVSEADDLVRFLAGFIVKKYPVSKDKVTRAKPASAFSESGGIKLLKGLWNETFLSELEAFPDEKVKDDQVDALSGAFNTLVKGRAALYGTGKW